jgi:6-pyruvoyltetrahydropterin/6-carboxytetrahydropterin synthase
MYTISKEFTFSASHKLENLPADHPCSRVHGHNYIVIIELESDKLDDKGFVVDYRKLDLIKQFINNHLDHRHLNDEFTFNPTAGNIAKYIYEIFLKTYPQLSAVTVKETPKTTVRYSPAYDIE